MTTRLSKKLSPLFLSHSSYRCFSITTRSAMPPTLQTDVKVQFDPKNMPFRRLGPSGLRVPVFSLGGCTCPEITSEDDSLMYLYRADAGQIRHWTANEGALDASNTYIQYETNNIVLLGTHESRL